MYSSQDNTVYLTPKLTDGLSSSPDPLLQERPAVV